jgi:hypothetical protein
VKRDGPGLTPPTPAIDPREAVLERLAERYEHFALEEQEVRGRGYVADAEVAHKYALWLLRAYEAESR